ncbi:APC family permease [Pediococcus claussenii]|uniref:Amino acid permease family protein n=1 Tax=Pediococcus claussenii (strain ATCC BAA-344 / DSM 14800 / JCM 18046 / KCTC 3811 / LMG 21948 / P06) TaxID=701521 RepID=G8PD74_PEDCP|nr:APC family permease [Pediococcus claussenii]AEV95209.1 amino acid permease family protein [Pediococcus claussenii ATCC BAA-344]ANZ70439.1 amino acid permease [Pediococcus claussenii]ANZ72255.1 amino acid permease [Pediococcus claussenii]KRN19608.1 hypothetical protein IV79_GL001325 [Pediococcus claussenii]
MKNKFSLFSIVILGVNAIIGSGIFLLPNQAMKIMGPASIGIFVFDMLLVISIALCYAEDSSLFKEDGGPYLYAQKAFGDFVGYEVGFIVWAISIIAWATMAAGLTTALGALFPIFNQPLWRGITITVLLVGLTAVNLMGIQVTKWLNNIVTVAKLIPLILFIAIGIFFMKGSNFTPVFPHGSYVAGSFGAAAILMFYAFTGFEALVIDAQDMEHPQKNLPKAIIFALGIVAALYILIQIVSIGVLGPHLASSQAPMQDAMNQIIGPIGKYAIAVGTIISILGIATAQSFFLPRIGASMAQNGVMPKVVGRRNRRGIPYVAMIISLVIALPLSLTGTFTTLAAISVVSRFAQYVPTILAVLVFRKKMPNQPRTFKIPFGPVIPIFAIIVSVWLLSHATVYQLIFGLGGLVIAVPFYFVGKAIQKRGGITNDK